MRIDPKELDTALKGTGLQVKTNADGQPIAWKGPYSADWFDNYTECLRENQHARRTSLLAKEGKNAQGQTKDQEKEFNDRKRIQVIRKQKSEAALLASESFNKGE